MAGGTTSSSTLNDSLPSVIDSARQIREQQGGLISTVDRVTLPGNEGVAWNEISLAQIDAQSVNELNKLDNPQQLSDTLLSLEPAVVGAHIILTQKVQARISGNVAAQIGGLLQNAIERKKDIDGLTVLDGATVSQPGAGAALTHGIVSAMVRQIQGNTTEPAPQNTPIHFTGHAFQIHDIATDITSGVGTYSIPDGLTAQVFAQGYQDGSVGGAIVHLNGNITIDGSADAKGGVYAQAGIVAVQGFSPRPYNKVMENMAGAEALWLYDEYIWGERSAGNWVKEIYSDATAPTS